VAGELFKMMTGADITHVPYRGEGPALIDLIGGQVQVMFSLLPGALEYIRAGTLRALAVTTAARLPQLPDLPPVGDFVPATRRAPSRDLARRGTRPTRLSTSSTRK